MVKNGVIFLVFTVCLTVSLSVQSEGQGHRYNQAGERGMAAVVDAEFQVKFGPETTTAVTLQGYQEQIIRIHVYGEPEQELHLHGFDVMKRTDSVGYAVLTFELTHTGRYPIVIHQHDLVLGNTEVAVAYIEVRSK